MGKGKVEGRGNGKGEGKEKGERRRVEGGGCKRERGVPLVSLLFHGISMGPLIIIIIIRQN